MMDSADDCSLSRRMGVCVFGDLWMRHRGVCNVQTLKYKNKKLIGEPIVQICHFKTFIYSINQKMNFTMCFKPTDS